MATDLNGTTWPGVANLVVLSVAPNRGHQGRFSVVSNQTCIGLAFSYSDLEETCTGIVQKPRTDRVHTLGGEQWLDIGIN